MVEKRLRMLGVFGIISLLSYTAMVVFSPLSYPGYDWLSMAVSDLCAEGAPSEALAARLNALFGPCALVSIMAVCVGAAGCSSRTLKLGIYCFAAMEWVCNVGYDLFPWVSDAPSLDLQNVMQRAYCPVHRICHSDAAFADFAGGKIPDCCIRQGISDI